MQCRVVPGLCKSVHFSRSTQLALKIVAEALTRGLYDYDVRPNQFDPTNILIAYNYIGTQSILFAVASVEILYMWMNIIQPLHIIYYSACLL